VAVGRRDFSLSVAPESPWLPKLDRPPPPTQRPLDRVSNAPDRIAHIITTCHRIYDKSRLQAGYTVFAATLATSATCAYKGTLKALQKTL
jgi:hypothetical protein